MRLKKLKSFLKESYFILTKHNMSCMSAQLTYALIVAIVPFFAVLFSFIHSKKNFQEIINTIVAPFIKDNFGLKVGNDILEYITSVVTQVQVTELSIISLISLLVTVILLLLLLESVFNTLLDAKKEKNYFISLLKCWLLLVFSPFLFVLFAIRSRIFLTALDLADNIPIDSSAQIVSFILGYISQVIFYALLYYIMPSRRPRFTAAILGGVITTVSLDILRYINIYLVKSALSADTSQLYGSVPLIAILFFVWLRLVLYIILVGFVFTTAAERVILKKTKHSKITLGPVNK